MRSGGPYVGLDHFSEDDQRFFFGRDDERRRIIGNLRAARLTLLYAQSGAGKSPLLHAGVAARLRGSERFLPVVVSAWRGDPTAAVVSALEDAVSLRRPGAEPPHLDPALAPALTAASELSRAMLLLVLDQFEDHLQDRSAAAAEFDDALADCINHSPMAHVLISIREDAYSQVGDRFKARIPNVYRNYLHLEYLDERAARAAAASPLGVLNQPLDKSEAHYEAEPELLTAVVEQVRRHNLSPADGDGSRIEPAYLQLVMHRLWDEEAAVGSRRLRLQTLERLGGAGAIVRAHLDDVMDALGERQRDDAAVALRYFVTSGGRTLAWDVGELAELSGVPAERLEPVLDRLEDGRILRASATPGKPDAKPRELFHDVLAPAVLDWRQRRRVERLEARNRRLTLLAATLAVVSVALAAYIWDPTPLRRVELSTIDARFGVRGAQDAPSGIAIVAVEAPGRARYAEVLRLVDAAGPRSIAVDRIFDSYPADERPAGTRELKAAIAAVHSPLVLAFDRFGIEANGVVPDVLDHDVKATFGYAGLPVDAGDVSRRLEREVPVGSSQQVPKLTPFAVAAARLANPGVDPGKLQTAARRSWGDQTRKTAWIDFAGKAGTVTRIADADLSAAAARRRLRGAVVVVAAAEGDDAYRTPLGTMPGPEIQANAVNTVLHEAPLRDAPAWVDVVLTILLAAFVPLVRPATVTRALLTAAAVAALYLVAAMAAFLAGWVIAVTVPLAALVLSTAVTLWLHARRPRAPRGGSLRRTGDPPPAALDRAP